MAPGGISAEEHALDAKLRLVNETTARFRSEMDDDDCQKSALDAQIRRTQEALAQMCRALSANTMISN